MNLFFRFFWLALNFDINCRLDKTRECQFRENANAKIPCVQVFGVSCFYDPPDMGHLDDNVRNGERNPIFRFHTPLDHYYTKSHIIAHLHQTVRGASDAHPIPHASSIAIPIRVNGRRLLVRPWVVRVRCELISLVDV